MNFKRNIKKILLTLLMSTAAVKASSEIKTNGDSILTERERMYEKAYQETIEHFYQGSKNYLHHPLFAASLYNILSQIGALIAQYKSNQFLLDQSLITACYRGNFEIAKKLFEAGANINPDYLQNSPLWNAAASKQVAIVQWLIENGANVNFAYKDNATPLHEAANHSSSQGLINRSNSSAIVELLLNAQANPFAINKNGQMPDQTFNVAPEIQALIANARQKVINESISRPQSEKHPKGLANQ